MGKVLKNLTVRWNWQGDIYAIKGFNIAITPSGTNVDEIYYKVVTTASVNGFATSYTFANLALDINTTYVAWVQALYENGDSDWISNTGITVQDDGTSTIAVINDVNEASGINKWIVKRYNILGRGYTTVGYDTISGTNAERSYVVDDATTFNGYNIFGVDVENYMCVATTYVNATQDFTISLTIKTDDNGCIYINGKKIVDTITLTNTNVTLSFKKGWNKIELMWAENQGADYFNLNTKLSENASVEKLSCFSVSDIVSEGRAVITENQLSDMSNDNKLTATEKLLLKKEYDSIVAEKPTLEGQATVLLGAGDGNIANFNGYYSVLNTYLSPILSNLNTTSDIVGTTLRTNFKNYYDAKAKLAKAVSDKLQGNIDGIQIGGRNLILNSVNNTITGTTSPMSSTFSLSDELIGDYDKLKGKTIITSFDIAINNCTGASGTYGNRVGIELCIKFTDGTTTYVNGWYIATVGESCKKRVAGVPYTFPTSKTVSAITGGMYIQITSTSTTIKNPKIEFGTKITDWTPAVEDADFGKIYCKGTGANRTANRVLTVNGENVYDTTGKGLQLTVLDRKTLVSTFSQCYDVYSTDTAKTDLATKLNGLTDNVIVVLTSYDSIAVNQTLADAMARCGGSGTIIGQSQTPYSLIGIPSIGKGAGLEVISGTTATSPYAEISTTVISGIIQGVNTINTGLLQNLSDMASDSKVTALEKTNLKRELDELTSEKAKLITQAVNYGLTTEKVNFDTAYTNLYNYLNPLLTDMTTTSDVNGTTLRGYFSDYADKKTALINALTDKTKTLANNAQSSADSANNAINNELRTNLLNSKVWYVTDNANGKFTQFGALTGTTKNEIVKELNPANLYANCWKVTDANHLNTGGGFNTSNVAVRDDKTYRFAVYFKKKVDQEGSCYFGCSTASTNNLDGTANTNPYFWTGDLPNLNQWYLLIGFVHHKDYTGTVSIGGIYDMNGNKVANCIDYKMKAGATTQYHRDYMYYVTTGNPEMYIYSPAIEAVDGTEAPLDSFFPNTTQRILNAENNLTDMASDNKVTPSEKITLKQDWDVIVDEYASLASKIIAFGVDSTNFTNAYNGLRDYLNTTLNVFGSMSTTTTLPDVALWKTKWKTYYVERANIFNDISKKAKDLADVKKRVFTTTPTTPYDIGDLWTDGQDLRKCKTARASGAYVATDWEFATDYVDSSLDSMVKSPTFTNWSGNYPVGMGAWGAVTPTKETTLTRNGGYSLRFNNTATVQAGATISSSYFKANPANVQYLFVECDFMIVSGAIAGSCILIDWAGDSSNRGTIKFADFYPSGVELNRWYTIRTVLARPKTVTTWNGTYSGYLLSNYSAVGDSAKDMVFDKLNVREATQQEIDAYTKIPVFDAWRPANKVTIDGAKIEAGTVSCEKLTVQNGEVVTGNLLKVTGAVLSSSAGTTNIGIIADGIYSIKTNSYFTFGTGTQNNNSAESAYIQVDLGKTYRIQESRAYFYSGDARYYWYKIKYSVDGSTWYYAVGNANNNGWVTSSVPDGIQNVNPTTNTFAIPITARYIRLYGNGNNVNTSNHIYEWQLLSTQLTSIDGGMISTGSILADRINGGTLTLGGGDNGNGTCVIYNDKTDKDGHPEEIARLDKNGLTLKMWFDDKDWCNTFSIVNGAHPEVKLINVSSEGDWSFGGVITLTPCDQSIVPTPTYNSLNIERAGLTFKYFDTATPVNNSSGSIKWEGAFRFKSDVGGIFARFDTSYCDSGYMEFYTCKANPAQRSAWIGYGFAGSRVLSIVNEIGPDIYLSSTGTTQVKSSGGLWVQNIYLGNDNVIDAPSGRCLWVNWGHGASGGLKVGNGNDLGSYGPIYGSSKNAVTGTENYGEVVTYADESPHHVFCDRGTGEFDENGECYVYLDPIYLETVNTSSGDYWVQLTGYMGANPQIKELCSDHFVVVGTPSKKFCWEVSAERLGMERLRWNDADIYI